MVIFVSGFHIFFSHMRKKVYRDYKKATESQGHWSLGPWIKILYYVKFPKDLTKNKAIER